MALTDHTLHTHFRHVNGGEYVLTSYVPSASPGQHDWVNGYAVSDSEAQAPVWSFPLGQVTLYTPDEPLHGTHGPAKYFEIYNLTFHYDRYSDGMVYGRAVDGGDDAPVESFPFTSVTFPTEPQEATMPESTTPAAHIDQAALEAVLAKVDELGHQVVELTAETAVLRSSVEAATQRAETAEAQQRQARIDLTRFQESVSDAIASAVNDDEVDRDVANGLLENLGLPGLTKTFRVTVRVKSVAEQDVEIDVEATDADEARQKVNDGDFDDEINDEIDSYSWEFSDQENKVPHGSSYITEA